MVTFSHIPYSVALAKGSYQDKLMKEVLSIDGIEKKYLSAEFEELITPFVERNLQFEMR